MNFIVLLLFFVNWVHSDKIYEIYIADQYDNIKTLDVNEKLRIIITNLDSYIYRKECNASCSSKSNGAENKFHFDCKVEEHYEDQKSWPDFSYYAYAEANINNVTKSLAGEWLCKFNLTRSYNFTEFVNVSFTLDLKEHCTGNYNAGNSIWKAIGIVAILVSIGETVSIGFIWLKSKGPNKSDRSKLTKNVSDLSTSAPPPPLAPKMKKRDTKNVIEKDEPLYDIPAKQIIKETPPTEGYEVMTPRTNMRMQLPSIDIEDTLNKKRLKRPSQEINGDNIYDNDIVLFKRPPFDVPFNNRTGTLIKSQSPKPKNCIPNTMLQGTGKKASIQDDSATSDDEWLYETLHDKGMIYKNVP